MIKKISFVAIIVAVALAAAIVFWPSNPILPHKTTAADDVRDATAAKPFDQAASPPIASARRAPSEGQSARAMNFDSILSVSAIELAAKRSGASRAETLEHLQSAVAFCEAVDWHSKHPSKREASGQVSAEGKLAMAYAKSFAQKFCDSPGMTSDAIAAEMLQLDATGDVLQSGFLSHIPEDEVKTVGVPAARRLFLEAKSVSAMKNAAYYLLEHDELPQTKTLPVPSNMNRTAVQVLALDMLACNTRGGCGPNGFYTAISCGEICRPGITMSDVWRDQHSPEAIRYAQALAAAISADRIAAAAAKD